MAEVEFSRDELEEARRALVSTLSKCEKVQPKLRPGTSQATLLERRIKALQIAITLIDQALAESGTEAIDATAYR